MIGAARAECFVCVSMSPNAFFIFWFIISSPFHKYIIITLFRKSLSATHTAAFHNDKLFTKTHFTLFALYTFALSLSSFAQFCIDWLPDSLIFNFHPPLSPLLLIHFAVRRDVTTYSNPFLLLILGWFYGYGNGAEREMEWINFRVVLMTFRNSLYFFSRNDFDFVFQFFCHWAAVDVCLSLSVSSVSILTESNISRNQCFSDRSRAACSDSNPNGSLLRCCVSRRLWNQSPKLK